MKWEGFIATGGLTFFLKDKPEEMKKMKDNLENMLKNYPKKLEVNKVFIIN